MLVEIAIWTDLQSIKANENKTAPTDRGVSFLKQGEKFPKSRRIDSSTILYQASDWVMQVDKNLIRDKLFLLEHISINFPSK